MNFARHNFGPGVFGIDAAGWQMALRVVCSSNLIKPASSNGNLSNGGDRSRSELLLCDRGRYRGADFGDAHYGTVVDNCEALIKGVALMPL